MKTLTKTLLGLSLVVAGMAQAAEPIEALEAALKKNADAHQAILVKVVQSNPKLDKEVKVLTSELNAIQHSGKDPAVRTKMAQAEMSKRTTLLAQIYSAAKFDEAKYHADQLKTVSAYNQKSKQKVRYTKRGKLSYQLIELPDFEAPTEGAEIVLTKPFPFVETQENGDGTITIQREEGFVKVEADSGNFSNFSNIGGLGHFFEIPSNTHRIRVSAEIPEAFSHFLGIANLGGGMGKTKFKINVEGEDQVICTKTKTLDTFYLYFLDITSNSSQSSIAMACEFDAPPAGQRIVIRFLGHAIVDTGLATVYTDVSAEPSAIRIRLNPLQ